MLGVSTIDCATDVERDARALGVQKEAALSSFVAARPEACAGRSAFPVCWREKGGPGGKIFCDEFTQLGPELADIGSSAAPVAENVHAGNGCDAEDSGAALQGDAYEKLVRIISRAAANRGNVSRAIGGALSSPVVTHDDTVSDA